MRRWKYISSRRKNLKASEIEHKIVKKKAVGKKNALRALKQ